MGEHVDGPRFSVTTWRDEGGWHARAVVVRPEAAPFTDPADEQRAALSTTIRGVGFRDPEDAVKNAVHSYLELYGRRCYCRDCEEKGELAKKCVGACQCGGKRRVLP